MPSSPYPARAHHWQQLLPTPTTGTVFSTPADITYLTGFEFLLPAEREAYVLVIADAIELWHAAFSPLPPDLAATVVARPMRGFNSLLERLQALATAGQLTTLQFDAQNLTVAEHQRLTTLTGVELVSFSRQNIWQLRQQKDSTEIAALQQACELTTRVVAAVSATLKPGVTEQALAWQLEEALRQAGITQLAFPTIVAFGDHTALPHHQPTSRALTPETAVLIDIGGRYHNYCADMTRSWWFGSTPPAEYQQIEATVQRAYAGTLGWLNAQLAAGQPILAKAIDDQARGVIVAAGFGPEFVHTTGHGIGLEVHEPPSVSWQNAAVIPPHTCLTVEPGIYLPGKFGYRYENTLLLTETAARELTLLDHA